jgi:hypothetical protein
MLTDDLQERATSRRLRSLYRIGAAFDRDVTEPGRDGRAYRSS